MSSRTSSTGKAVVDEWGIFLPARWRRAETCIDWKDVRTFWVDSNWGSLKVFYTDKDGKTKAAWVGRAKAYRGPFLNYWKDALIAELAATGELSGEAGPARRGSGSWALAVTLAAWAGLVCYVIGHEALPVLRRYQGVAPELRTVMRWSLWTGGLLLGFYAAMIPVLLLFDWRMGAGTRRWRGWRITREGLFRKTRWGNWEPVVLREGDLVSPNRLVLGGRPVPLWAKSGHSRDSHLQRSIVLPYLVAILARRRGIAPVPARYLDFSLAAILRAAFLWPLVILGLCFLPRLFWEAPDLPHLSAAKLVGVVFGISMGMAAFLSVPYLWAARVARRQLPEFLAETEAIRKKLGW